MEQQLMALLGGEAAALMPGMMGTAPAPTTQSPASPAFADVLNTALDSLAGPDAAALALLSQQVSMLMPTAVNATQSAPALLTTMGSSVAVAEAAGGNELPFGGNDIPRFNAKGLPNIPESSITALLRSSIAPGEPLFSVGAERAPSAHEAGSVISLSSLSPLASLPTPASLRLTAIASESDPNVIEQFAPQMGSGGVFPNVGDGSSRHDRRGGERSFRLESKGAVMDSLSALSSVMTPVSSMESAGKSYNAFTLISPSVSPAIESVPAILDNTVSVNSGLQSPLVTGTTARSDISISQSPQQPGWGEAFVERVTFMVKHNLQEAEIRLNPPQLGQIDVRISMSNDQASMIFSSPHAAVRDAIETSMVRLRELLGESGINLANVDVSDKSLAQQHQGTSGERDTDRPAFWNGHRAEFALDESAAEILGASGNGRIDYYA